ncbi:MAG: S41 family peptidase [Blastocatellia bacterium]
MKTICLFAFLALLNCPWLVSGSHSPQFPREKWRQDYQSLKEYLRTGYANLEWMKQARKLDLAALDAETQRALDAANSDAEARRALEKFLAAFGDGHLGLSDPVKPPPAGGETGPSFDQETAGDKVCQALGFRIRSNRFSLPFEDAPKFTAVSGDNDIFRAGVFTSGAGKKYGVIRIPIFSPEGYWNGCQAAWEAYRRNLSGACGGQCLDEFKYYAAANHLSAKLAEQIGAFNQMRIDALIVDLGGNGGGSDWVGAVARILAGKPLRAPRMGFLRHQHWTQSLERRLKDVSEDLARNDLTRRQTEYLKTARQRLQQALKETQTPCDKSSVWSAASGKSKCSMLGSAPLYSTGVFDYLPSNELKNLNSKAVLFYPSRYEYQESVYKGRLFVLVDRGTASAAEYFAATLHDNGVATIAGEKTLGSGCGYTNGGLRLTLPNSGLRAQMPDCVRYRKDGSNEVEGVTPDLKVWEKDDSRAARLEKLLRALD